MGGLKSGVRHTTHHAPRTTHCTSHTTMDRHYQLGRHRQALLGPLEVLGFRCVCSCVHAALYVHRRPQLMFHGTCSFSEGWMKTGEEKYAETKQEKWKECAAQGFSQCVSYRVAIPGHFGGGWVGKKNLPFSALRVGGWQGEWVAGWVGGWVGGVL